MQQPPNYYPPPGFNPPPNFNPQRNLPNATGVLVLGICSLVFCFAYGILGLICASVALILSSGPKQEYEQNPQYYTLSSWNNLKAGRTCAIIGLILSALFIVAIILALFVFGAVVDTFAWH
ncbi:MAG: hypothetical protein FD123_2298 [Bacteroidetes bacterium]|nr:MAG: hypothetical protein FD123_2298 [Bacteroidota bacterium]